jgi:type I restriction enzyme M protein
LGSLVDRTHRDLSDDELARIARTYHAWRRGEASAHQTQSSTYPKPADASPLPYADIPGFCKSVTLDEIAAHGYVLTPGRYVGAEEAEDDDEPFDEKVKRLTEKLDEQFKESARLESAIRESMTRLRNA